jgi:hypothetical protein
MCEEIPTRALAARQKEFEDAKDQTFFLTELFFASSHGCCQPYYLVTPAIRLDEWPG